MSAIGLPVVLSLARWCWLVQTGFLRPRPTQGSGPQALRTCTGLSPSAAAFSKHLPLGNACFVPALQPPGACTGVWACPLSLATTRGVTVCFPFLRVLRCFSSPGRCHASVTPCLQHGGLPHSDTHGSGPVCGSPWLFAAYRVLRHPWEPRHPPCALACFLSLPRGPSPGGAFAHRAPLGALRRLIAARYRTFLSQPCQ